jgi:hypothetical protein
LAAASTGGAVTLMRSSAPRGVVISLVEARGCNLTKRSVAPGWLWRKGGCANGLGVLAVAGGFFMSRPGAVNQGRRSGVILQVDSSTESGLIQGSHV